MANNEQQKNSSEINLHAEVTVIQTYKRTHIKKQQNNRNYRLLQTGKEILIRNYNGIKSIMQRNYRRFSN